MALRTTEATRQFTASVGPLEEAFGQRARLAIMSCLVSAGRLSFLAIKEELGLTDGNLSSHLSYLERKGFVSIEKGFQGKRPYTEAKTTEEGRAAFEQYVKALETWVSALNREGKRSNGFE